MLKTTITYGVKKPIQKYYMFRENAVKVRWNFIKEALKETGYTEKTIIQVEFDHVELISSNGDVIIEHSSCFNWLSITVNLIRVKIDRNTFKHTLYKVCLLKYIGLEVLIYNLHINELTITS